MGLFSSISKFVGGLDPTGVVSGALGFAGGLTQNRANSAQAQRQMDFQERMRSTSYQTSMTDMRKAGLNPIFAYQQGGAPMAMGAQATMQNSAAAGMDAYNSTTNSAIALRQNRKLLTRMDEEINNLKEQNKAIKMQAWKDGTQAAVNEQLALRTLEEKFLAQNAVEVSDAEKKQRQIKADFASKHPNALALERIIEGLGKLFKGSASIHSTK